MRGRKTGIRKRGEDKVSLYSQSGHPGETRESLKLVQSWEVENEDSDDIGGGATFLPLSHSLSLSLALSLSFSLSHTHDELTHRHQDEWTQTTNE